MCNNFFTALFFYLNYTYWYFVFIEWIHVNRSLNEFCTTILFCFIGEKIIINLKRYALFYVGVYQVTTQNHYFMFIYTKYLPKFIILCLYVPSTNPKSLFYVCMYQVPTQIHYSMFFMYQVPTQNHYSLFVCTKYPQTLL